MVNENDPASIPYVINENGFWYIAYKEKNPLPYVTVSAKGIANGLSTEINDGADFGPDSYDPTASGSYGNPPYTKTSGIQEAINHIFNNNGGKIFLKSGVYYLTGGFHQTTIPGENGQWLIYIPYNSNDNPAISIEIEGEIDMMPLPASGSNILPTSSGVIIYNKSSVSSINPGSAPYPSVIGGGISSGGVNNHISLTIKNIIVRQAVSPASTPYNNQVGGINLQTIDTFKLENVRVDVDATFNSGAPSSAPIPDPSLVQNATGIATTNPDIAGGSNILSNVAVIGYGVGISDNGQTEMYKVNIMYCKWAMNLLSSNHIHKISYLNTNNNPYTFRLVQGYNSSFTNLYLDFQTIDIQNNNVATDWIAIVNHITNLNLSGKIYGYMRGVRTAPPDSGVAMILDSNVSAVLGHLHIKYVDQVVPSVSIPANPPASATVYQNTNPYDITIDLPVYATTAGTAGTVAYGISSTSTVTEMTPRYVNGATSSTAVDIVSLRVPAGWYYEFTGSGVTFGTATVQAV